MKKGIIFTISLIISVFCTAEVKADTLTTKVIPTFRAFRQGKFQVVHPLFCVSPLNKKNTPNQENEYFFYKQHDLRSLQYFLRNYLLIQHRDDWYINAERLGLGIGFCRVIIQGKYWVFLVSKPQIAAENLGLHYNTNLGHFEPDSSAIQMRQYMYYALNTTNFETTALTFAGMLKLLNPYPSLQLQFVKDKYNDDNFVILAYLKELNRYIAYFEKDKTSTK